MPAVDRSLTRILVASSLGTLFEWYDFYLYGTRAVFFGELFPTSIRYTSMSLPYHLGNAGSAASCR
ncbi:MAG: hypothetical protein ACREI7_08425 [Myxococcota bacterium]